jgi:hypothetical protein
MKKVLLALVVLGGLLVATRKKAPVQVGESTFHSGSVRRIENCACHTPPPTVH